VLDLFYFSRLEHVSNFCDVIYLTLAMGGYEACKVGVICAFRAERYGEFLAICVSGYEGDTLRRIDLDG